MSAPVLQVAKPIVHINGTSRDALLAGYNSARLSVREAVGKVESVGFNARDYYPGGDELWQRAKAEHAGRVSRLRAVEAELEEIVGYLLDGA